MNAAFAALAVGLFNPVMFPAVFTLTLERSSAASATSGLKGRAIVGGAVLPLLGGRVADLGHLNLAVLIPAPGYAILTVFVSRRPHSGARSRGGRLAVASLAASFGVLPIRRPCVSVAGWRDTC